MFGNKKKTVLFGLAIVGMAVLVGLLPVACQSSASAQGAGSWVPSKVARVYDTDILIVGAGGSGLACAVQSAINGVDFIVIEKADFVGGNANMVEGMFAVNSRFQREKGITVKSADIVHDELFRAQYRPNGALWVDLCQRSAGNIDWLVEQGIQYSGVIDDYYGGLYPTFHWFKDAKGEVGYVEPMYKKLQEYNVTIHLNTAGKSLIMRDGKVTGVFAEGPEGAVRFNAKAVILATGGFGGSVELIKEQGWDTTGLSIVGTRNASGDGYRMARAVGAK